MKIKLILLFSIWALVFYPVYTGLFSVWLIHSNNSHGILVPIVSLFFVCIKSKKINLLRLLNSKWGLVLLVLSLGLYLLNLAGEIAFVSRLVIVTSLIWLVLYDIDRAAFKCLSFPHFLLGCIVEIVAFPLRTLAPQNLQ